MTYSRPSYNRTGYLPYRSLLWVVLLTSTAFPLWGQGGISPDFTLRDPLPQSATGDWLRPDSTFNRGRFYTAAGVGAGLYGVATYGLYQAWYADFERADFRTFDDSGEWLQMDKAGHAFTAYMFNRYAFAGLRWAGLKRPAARWTAFGVAQVLQGTIEVLDGYSAEWGFSWSDMAANASGSLLFTVQDITWREQRMLLKVSNDLRDHPDVPVFNAGGTEGNLGYVSRTRFGDNLLERYLKDYNAQTLWLSVNPRAFLPQSKFPVWLNVAVGYGAENVYGAYGNTWMQNGQRFRYEPERYRQWFLSPDLYLSRIPTKKRWVRLILGALDAIKIPAPALEYSKGRFRGHWLMW